MSDRDCGTQFQLCGDCIRCLRHQRDFARERLKDAASDLADITDQHEALRAEMTWLTSERDELLQRVETLRELADRAAHEQGVAQRRLLEVQRTRSDLLEERNKAERERDEARAEVERLRAEVEMLRGVGCREAKADEPESGPCGVCLRCAEERGGAYELRRAADLVEDAAVAAWLRERATQIERGEV